MTWRVVRRGVIPSTQDLARALVNSGAGEGLAVVAESQTRGRGRRGRRWHSSPGGLYMTAVLRPYVNAGLVPLVAGLAVVDAIADVSGLWASLKWPNDVMLDGFKVGGILAEAHWFGDEAKLILLGLGVNVNNKPPGSLPLATSLCSRTEKMIDIENFATRLLASLSEELCIVDTNPEALLERWRSTSSTLKRMVEIELHDGGTIRGIAVDIGRDGGLMVEAGGEIKRILSAAKITEFS